MGDFEVHSSAARHHPLDLGLIVESSSQPFAAGTPDGHFIYFNQAFCELTGYSADELKSFTWPKDLTPPEWQERETQALAEVRRTGQPQRYEKQYVRKDGSRVVVESLLHAALDEAGKVAYYYSFVTDISERKQAEALRQSELLHRLVAENAYDWSFWVGPRGQFLYCSPSCERISGYSSEEFEADPELFRRIVHPQDRASLDEHERTQHTPDAPAAAIEYRIVTRAGEVRWIEHVCQAAHSDSGAYLGRFGAKRDITRRREAEQQREQLQEENCRERAFLEAVLESIAEAVCVHDSEGRIIRLNPAAQQLFNYSSEQMRQPYWERVAGRLILQEDGHPFPLEELPLARALRGETARSVVIGLKDASESLRWFIYSAAPVLGPNGGILGAVVTSTDITDLRRSQEHLKEARAQAQALAREAARQAAELDVIFSTIPTGVIVYGADGRIVRMNDMAARYGFYRHEGRGLSTSERAAIYHLVGEDGTHLPPENWPAERALRGETVREEIIGHVNPEGKTVWWVTSAAPVCSTDGSVVGAVVAYHDISELRHTQESLQRSNEELAAANEELQAQAEELAAQNEELITQRDELERLARDLELERRKLRIVIDSAPMAVVVADEHARVLMANPRAEELCVRPIRYGEDYPAHASLRICYPDGTPCDPRDLPLTRSALDGEVIRGMELAIEWPDGQRRDLLVASAPVLDWSGKVTGAVGVFEDITDLKDLEREREALERSKDDFLSVISHELRTPLASIMGYSEALLDEQSPPPASVQREFLQAIFDSAGRVNLLIDDLLDLTRLGQRTFRLMLEPVRLEAVVQRAVELMKPMALEKGQSLELRMEDSLPVLTADAQRLGQVLGNLVSNAIKFSPKGASIALVSRAMDGEVTIEVTDSGGGIAPEDVPHIFERFYRGKNATRASGTGLGLYVAKEIVEAHGGRIEVENSLGRGATFRVRLPSRLPAEEL